MPFLSGIGFSQNKDPVEAAKEAAARAKKSLANDRIDLAILFCTMHYPPETFLPVIYEVLNRTRIIGCSTAGIILPRRVETRGIGIALINSERTHFGTSHQNRLDLQDKTVAGFSLAKECSHDFGPQHRKLMLFFADGLIKDFSQTLRGIRDHLGEELLILGAGSSDDLARQKTFQFHNDKFLTKGVTAALFAGQPRLAFSCQHGWKALGKPRTVDRVDGHLLRSIDGKKAFALLEDYFAAEAHAAARDPLGPINIRYPLGFRINQTNEYLLRNVLGALDDGSVICQDTVEKGSEVHIMINNTDYCIAAAEEAARDLKRQCKESEPGLVLVFESAYRLKMLGHNATREIQLFSKILDSDHIFGMYSYGEFFAFSPDNQTSQTLLQNDSLLAIALN